MAKLLSHAELWQVDAFIAFILTEDDFAEGDPEFESIDAKRVTVAFWRTSSEIYSWHLLLPSESRRSETISPFWSSISEVRVSTGSAVVGGIEGLGPSSSVDEEDYADLAADYSDDFDEDDGEPFDFSACRHVAFGQSGDVFVENRAGRLILISPGESCRLWDSLGVDYEVDDRYCGLISYSPRIRNTGELLERVAERMIEHLSRGVEC